jgi:signal transduction histidine kinase
VQLIALALLRLEGLRPNGHIVPGDTSGVDDVGAIEAALRDALKDIRGMSSGLSLPKMEGSTLTQVLEYAVRNHERRSRTRVTLALAPNLPRSVSPQLLACLYRFTQEGLNNATKHAGGKDQAVRAYFDGQQLVVEVRDGGPGLAAPQAMPDHDNKGLGLTGLIDRIESLHGKLDIDSPAGSGTTLKARFDKSALDV